MAGAGFCGYFACPWKYKKKFKGDFLNYV